MNNLLNELGTLFHPVKALVIYERKHGYSKTENYVESYDMDANGCPVNVHPFSVKEANALAKSLLIAEKKQRNFLNPQGLLNPNIVFLKTGHDGYAIWRSPAQKVRLLFSDGLGLPCGEASIPSLLWKATRSNLFVFAVTDEDINTDTLLYHAPFFNVSADGRVCMGNVSVKIPNDCCLENFMKLWEEFFFNSFFSHLFSQHMPVKGNIIQLWQRLLQSGEPFPTDHLIANNIPLTKLIQ